MDRFSAHLDRSWDLITKGETIQALAAAKQALDIDRESPEVHNLLGYIHALDGDFDEALECYRNAIDLDEWYLEPLLNAAELLAHTEGDPGEAIRLCRQAGELELSLDEQADALLIETEALLNLSRDTEARERLSELADPETLPAVYQVAVGRALFDAGDAAAAIRLLERAVEQDDTTAEAWYTLGLIAREEGRRVDAVVAFQKTRLQDLKLPRVPWSKPDAVLATLAAEVIAGLEPDLRALLEGVEIRVEAYPSVEMIRREIDPRQVVLAEGIDPDKGTFDLLWIFSATFERYASPANTAEELAGFIAAEVGRCSVIPDQV